MKRIKPCVNSAGASKTRATETHIEAAPRFWVNRRQYGHWPESGFWEIGPPLYKNYRPNCLTPQKSANIDESESLNESESVAGNFRHYWFQSVLAPFEIIDLERKVIGAGITIGQ